MKIDKLFHEGKTVAPLDVKTDGLQSDGGKEFTISIRPAAMGVSGREGQEVKSAHGNLFRTSLKRPSRARQ